MPLLAKTSKSGAPPPFHSSIRLEYFKHLKIFILLVVPVHPFVNIARVLELLEPRHNLRSKCVEGQRTNPSHLLQEGKIPSSRNHICSLKILRLEEATPARKCLFMALADLTSSNFPRPTRTRWCWPLDPGRSS